MTELMLQTNIQNNIRSLIAAPHFADAMFCRPGAESGDCYKEFRV